MLPPEIEEGNVEYKRHLCSDELKTITKNFNVRFQQLVTQMKYRLYEGNGIAIYYIGVEDDGSFYKLSKEQRKDSMIVIKKMVLYLEASIDSVIFNENYVKIIIKDKWKSNILPEKRVLLLGDTETGKSTFLAYLIKNKLDSENCKARLYVLNHKHELESGKTSSLNYHYKIHNKTKYVFIDTPGDDKLFSKSNKIRNKILLSFKFDLVLFFNKNECEWYKKEMFNYFVNLLKIPYFEINLFNDKSIINLINPIEQSEMMNIFEKNIKNKPKINNQLVNFHLLKSYPHIDMGWILSGFLESGKLKVNQDLLWYENDKLNVKVNSIYQNNSPVEEIIGPCTTTITLKDSKYFSNKPRYGFLSNIHYLETYYVKINWVYYSDEEILNENELHVSIRNFTLVLKKLNYGKYEIISPKPCYNVLNNYFIFEKGAHNSIGKLVK